MDLKNLPLFLKDIKNYLPQLLPITLITFIISVIVNFLLVNNNKYLTPLLQYHVYVILVSILSAIILIYISTIKYSDCLENKKLFLEFDNFLQNLSNDEIEIIELLKKGVNNINPTTLKCQNTTAIKILQEKKIVKIINEGSFKKYKSYFCDLSDEYKKYLKQKK